MHRLLLLVVVAAGCAARSQPTTSSASYVPALEARVSKLEAENARYADALQFLQRVYEQQAAAASADADREPAPDAIFAVPVAEAVAAGQVNGASDAAVTIVKAFDFACPYCAKLDVTLDELVAEYAGKVRVVYQHLVVHPFAMAAHLSSCAAGKQGKYLAFKKAVWEKAFRDYAAKGDASKLAEENLVLLARGVGLDGKRFTNDLHSAECKSRIEADRRDLETFGASGTPTLYMNGTMLAPGLSKSELKSAIEAKLRLVGSSGVSAADYYAKEIIAKGEKQFRSRRDPKP
jgi:protein-disulfide isomerase